MYIGIVGYSYKHVHVLHKTTHKCSSYLNFNLKLFGSHTCTYLHKTCACIDRHICTCPLYSIFEF